MGSVQPPKWSHNFLTPITKLQSHSSSLRPVTKVFTCWKWFIGYNFGIDDPTESKFGTHEELIVLNILKYKCCVNNSSDLSRDHFAKICKLLTNRWPVFSKSRVRILYLVHVLYPVRSPWTAVRSPCFILPGNSAKARFGHHNRTKGFPTIPHRRLRRNYFLVSQFFTFGFVDPDDIRYPIAPKFPECAGWWVDRWRG